MRATTRITRLDGRWQLRWCDGQRGDRPEAVAAGRVDLQRAWSARVPGSVHETLIEHGVIPDPNNGAAVLQGRWVEETLWTYHRTFRAPRLTRGQRAWLVFDQLDLGAIVYLNGTEIGRHANAFYPCRIEVTPHLAPGMNRLVVRLESGLFTAMHRSADGYGLNVDSQLTKRNWLRTTQNMHGWDWAPRLLNVGIRGSVHLDVAAAARWESCSAFTTVAEDFSVGAVTVRVQAEGLATRPQRGVLTVRIPQAKSVVRQAVTLTPGMNRLEAMVAVPAPRLWWPVGLGRPARYAVEIDLRVGGRLVGRARKRVGFRRVRVNQEPHPQRGRFFVIEINGRPVFCKGGNFVPPDTILSRVTPRRYATLVARALEANANMLRVWGGGQYEADAFYDLCDARGILVWQEFVFACAKYPATDEAFLADVKREAAYQVRRLAHHPSLVVWCGNNEMEQGNYEWGYERGVAFPDHALFHLVLPRIVAEEDPTRYYQASSPMSPALAPPNDDHHGDQHPWSIGFADTDFRKYRAMISRFPNEGGILGPTALPTIRACLAGGPARIGAFAWELHDNAITYWNRPDGAYPPDRMIADWTGRRVESMSIEDYAYWGGLVQGAGLAEYIRNFRRRMFDSAAAIFWMFNDCWPATRSWTIVDYHLRRTPAFWPVRRAFAPIALAVVREHQRVCIYGINDGPAREASLRCGLMALAGGYPLDFRRRVTLHANASTPLADFDARRWDRLGVTSHVACALLTDDAGSELARDALFLPRFADMRWPRVSVRVHRRGDAAIFTSTRFAWRVCLDLDGERALPDNFFDVYPGIPTVLRWPARLGTPRILRIGNG